MMINDFFRKGITALFVVMSVGMVGCSGSDDPQIEIPDSPSADKDSGKLIHTLSFVFPDYPEAEQIWLKEDYIDATLRVGSEIVDGFDADSAEDLDSGDFVSGGDSDSVEEYELTVRGRGNSTWGMPKKPMRLKFKKKTELCGLRNAKNFVLLANYIDPSHMRNAVALWLGNRLGVPNTNQFEPCNVYVNDKYVGLFLLTNKIGINSGSVDIDEEKGILFELSTEYDETYKFRSAKYNLPVMVKDPDFDDLADSKQPEVRLEEWQKDFERAERLAAEGRASEVFDMESVVNYMLVQEICGNSEIGHPKSWYMYKEEIGEDHKYIFGPIWDFDAAFNNVYMDGVSLINHPESAILQNPLLRKITSSEEYQELYARRFEEFINVIWPELSEFIADYSFLIRNAAEMDGERWNIAESIQDWTYHYPSTDYNRHVKDLTNWLGRRISYLSKRHTTTPE